MNRSFLLRPRLAAAFLLAGAATAQAAPGSCPQQDLTHELPQSPFDPQLIVNADHFAQDAKNVYTLSGSVHVAQAGREFKADALHYDADAHTVSADSESLFRNTDQVIVRSQRASYDLEADSGQFFGTRFSLPRQAARGSAEEILVQQRTQAELFGARYTSCPPEHESWLLSAEHLHLNQDSGLGTAHDAVLHVGGVPVLWLPYFQFPIDDRRRSGFLVPTFGQSRRDGFDLRVPFYINLAPNYDLTLIPRILTKRGVQLGSEFRYLLDGTHGELHTEYLNNDADTSQERDYVDYTQQTRFSRGFAFSAHYAEVSDPNYFADLGGSKFDSVSTPYLERSAQLTYQAPAQYTIRTLVQDFQPLAGLTSAENPYQRIPAVLFSGQTKNRWNGLGAGLDGDFTNFSRTDSVEGQRLYADPYLRWEQDHRSWFAAAQTDFTYTAYNLSGTADGDPTSPRRGVPQFSLDSGLRFDRITASGNLQTLEPRLFYLYVPYRAQNDLPVFDSGLPDFDFPQLFSRNRYSGEDRIADANNLTTALTTRLLDPNLGVPRLTASIGQIYHFQGSRVSLPDENPPDQGSSDYVGDLSYQLTRHWSSEGLSLFSPDLGKFTRSDFVLRYNDEHGTRLDLGYRYLRESYEQTDLSLTTPIKGGWSLAGRVRYSLRDQELLDGFGGIEYQTCCWAIRTTYRRYLTAANGQFDEGFYLQVELKGLTHVGSGFQNLLPREE